MFNVNRVELIGRLGRDPEVRHTASGTPVINASVCTTEGWRDKQSGERRERTEWHRIVIWNEAIGKTVQTQWRKGDLVRVIGQLETRKWTDQQGVEKYSTEVVVRPYSGDITILEDWKKGGAATSSDSTHPDGGGYAQPDEPDDLDDEIPFVIWGDVPKKRRRM
jgi:single-strand DNA-binding protein